MTVLRTLAARALAHLGPAHLGRYRHLGHTLVLTYHNIVASASDAGADRLLHLGLNEFARQLDFLRRKYDVIPLEDSLSVPAPGSRPRIAISFDDAYRGAVSHGVEVLSSAGMPATIFVTPGRLGDDQFWWDSFEGTPIASARFRRHVLEQLAGDEGAARNCASQFGMIPTPVPVGSRTATESELRMALTIHPGLTIGAHSWTHPNLAALDAERLHEELVRPRSWLRQAIPERRSIDWLSYPYGLTSPTVAAAARAAGYQAAVATDGGWMITPRDVYSVPRLTIPGDVTADGFILRTAGLRQ